MTTSLPMMYLAELSLLTWTCQQLSPDTDVTGDCPLHRREVASNIFKNNVLALKAKEHK